jgi:hypothetical protein
VIEAKSSPGIPFAEGLCARPLPPKAEGASAGYRKELSMRHQWMTFYLSSAGAARWVQPSVLALGVTCVSVFGQGCGQSIDSPQSSGPADLGAEEALRAIENCQALARDCFVTSDAVACEEQLRACLLSSLPDAGGPTPHPERDAATPPPHPERDAGSPPHPDPDAGPPDDDHDRDAGGTTPPRDGSPPSDPPSHDAGIRNLPDAAKGALNDPVGNDGGPAVLSCVNELRACLATGARPSTCAEDSRVCLSRHDGG